MVDASMYPWFKLIRNSLKHLPVVDEFGLPNHRILSIIQVFEDHGIPCQAEVVDGGLYFTLAEAHRLRIGSIQAGVLV